MGSYGKTVSAALKLETARPLSKAREARCANAIYKDDSRSFAWCDVSPLRPAQSRGMETITMTNLGTKSVAVRPSMGES